MARISVEPGRSGRQTAKIDCSFEQYTSKIYIITQSRYLRLTFLFLHIVHSTFGTRCEGECFFLMFAVFGVTLFEYFVERITFQPNKITTNSNNLLKFSCIRNEKTFQIEEAYTIKAFE